MALLTLGTSRSHLSMGDLLVGHAFIAGSPIWESWIKKQDKNERTGTGCEVLVTGATCRPLLIAAGPHQ